MKSINQAPSKVNVWKITFINFQITFSSESYKKWLKILLKENVQLTEWNFQTVVHFFPFLFGFYKLIFDRYQEQTLSYFFEQSIPANKILTENSYWDTFEYIKLKNLDINTIKEIDIYHDSFIINFNEKNQQSLIGFFSPQQTTQLKKLNANHYFLVLDNFNNILNEKKTSKNVRLNKLSYNLDEIPLKLEKIINKTSKNESFFNFELNSLKDNSLVEKSKKLSSIYKNQTKTSLPQVNNKIFESENKKIIGINNSVKKDSDLLIKNHKDEIFSKKLLVEKELESLFYDTGLKIIVEKSEVNSSFSKSYFKKFSNKETLKILAEFLPIKQNLNFLKLKRSGYFYPDLNSKDVSSLVLTTNIKSQKNNISLKINLPASFLLSETDSKFLTHLRKKLPITDRKDGFFGLNLDQSLKENSEDLNESKLQYSFLKEINKKETKRFEDFDDLDPDSWFLGYKNIQNEKKVNFEFNTITQFLKEKETKDILVSSFFKNQKNKLSFHYNPYTESLLPLKFSNYSNFGEIYRRFPNLENFGNSKKNNFEKNTFKFSESWEPISSNSWMIIIQFSVGLFLLRLLKDLYKDYGKELVEYIVQFASSSGIDVEEIKEQYLYDDPGYRIIKKVQKNFTYIAGIDNILPELGEIVWFLRNRGRSAKFRNSIPKGILLTGPPGTGKTLLVQAIAGEAQVPVIVESGSLLSDPQQKGRGIEKLKKIFDQARQIAPCIIFIDEVDTIGEKRQNIIQTAMGGDEIIESIYQNQEKEYTTNFIQKPLNLDQENQTQKDLEYELFRGTTTDQDSAGLEKFQQNMEAKKTRLSLLTQFLVEMDGLKNRKGVIVIGATNRPTVLDPALIRPGRFDKTLHLELPGKKKRIEILKLYSKKLKIDKKISWNYLANRTKGFSAADLAAAMNESAIQSILKGTTHTLETIEKGIDLVTSYSFENNSSNSKEKLIDPFFLSRLAYYQSGKGILHSLLPNHDPIVVLHLYPRQKNARHARFYEKTYFKTKTRLELESELIGFYSGKAAELVALYGNKKLYSVKKWQSDLGFDDLISGTYLANLMVDQWFLFSNKLLIRKNAQVEKNRNKKEFGESEKLQLNSFLENQVEDEIEVEQIAKLFRSTGYQQRGFGPWWQIQVSKQTSEIDSFFADWYRIYLPDPEESILNLEWIPPDEFYHSNDSLKKISSKSDLSFNDLYKIERDYIYHGLVLNSFNNAFSYLEDLREFLDYFADYLLRYSILREDQILYLLKDPNRIRNNIETSIKTVNKPWGNQSRRKNSRFINLNLLKSINLN